MFDNYRKYLAEKKELKRPKTGSVCVADEGEQKENPNDFFGETDDTVEKVKEMNQLDPKLFGLIQTRKLALMSLGREITGEGKEADFAREWYAGLTGVYNTIYEMLSAISVGFSVIEMVWQEKDGMFIIESLKARKQTRFKFDDKTNELLMTTKDNTDGIKTNPHKFAVTTFQPEYSNRYGQSLYMKLWWYWFIKKKSVKFWAIFAERFAVPIVVAKEGKNMSKENKDALDSFVKKIKTAVGIKVPQDVIIEFLQAAQAGTITTYESFLGYLDSSIAIGVLGQTLTSDTGKVGSYALGKIHENIRGDYLLADILMTEETWNDQILKPMIDFNFQDVKVYPKFNIAKGKAVDKDIMSKVIKTIGEAGFNKTPMSFVHKIFGIPAPIDGEEVLKPYTAPAGGSNQFTEKVMKAEEKIFMEELRKLR